MRCHKARVTDHTPKDKAPWEAVESKVDGAVREAVFHLTMREGEERPDLPETTKATCSCEKEGGEKQRSLRDV